MLYSYFFVVHKCHVGTPLSYMDTNNHLLFGMGPYVASTDIPL